MYLTDYKDRPAVAIESDRLTAVFLPEDGAKMASLRVRETNRELFLERLEERYRVLAYDGNFETSECRGFDDLFPTVDSCLMTGAGKT